MELIMTLIIGAIAYQTDWMGGAGVLGPVSNWGTRYYAGDSITTAIEGQISLIATQWDYTSSGWEKHTVESNSGISSVSQGFMPVDIDGDGILDLIALTDNEVVWYQNSGGYNFTKNVIGPANDGSGSCIYPCDLDEDGDMDVLVGTNGVGLGWYENQSLSWVWHSLDSSIGYHRVSAADVELDGDFDIIGVDNSEGPYAGDIYLFRNDGFQTFTKEPVADLSVGEGWRVYPQDFNNDGYADLYATWYSTYIFLNDQTGSFTESFHADYWAGVEDFDGTWPSDLDMDGDADLVVGTLHGNCFYAFLNDGTGMNFTFQLLNGTCTPVWYGDGAMARDIDLDGWPDIAGDGSEVGWFRQDSNNPLEFILYCIDVPQFSHWLYAAPMNEKCIPSIDLFVTDEGSHIVYENKVLEAFASCGWLESSILELQDTCDLKYLKYFGYEACVPNDTALAFYWRAGLDSADIVNSGWNGPEYATVGLPEQVDSFSLSSVSTRVFQYKTEFRNDDDIAVLYEVWLTWGCAPEGIEETSNYQLSIINYQLSIYPNPATAGIRVQWSGVSEKQEISLKIYDLSGRLVKSFPLIPNHSSLTTAVEWDRKDDAGKVVPAGVYFCKLDVGEKTIVKKLIAVQ